MSDDVLGKLVADTMEKVTGKSDIGISVYPTRIIQP